MDIERELAKLRYQVEQLGSCVNYRKHPIARLIVELDWTEGDFDAAEEIFESHDNFMESHDGRLDGGQLEMELRERFDIGYQTVKTIVLAFWRNRQFQDVCKAYAKQYSVSEFREILRSDDE